VVHRGNLRQLSGVAIVVVLLAAFTAVQLTERARGAADTRCTQHAADAAARARTATGSGAPVTVIGDSWSVGLGLADLADSWPSRLPGRVSVAGFSGSGFSPTASRCGDVSFADRAPAAVPGSGLVVVEGGLNDHDQSEASLIVGFHRLMPALAGHRVIVVGPASAPSRLSSVPRIDHTLAALARQYGVPYVRTSGWRLPYSADRLHLTAEGHRMFGDAVARELADRGLLSR
jgi:acyl-CoA thioesterase-1